MDKGHAREVAWEPGLWKRAPWTALLGLLAFAVCCAGLGAVLAASDGKEVAVWPRASVPVSVSVLLSLLVSIANVCLAIALGQAYEIAWWLSAIKGAELRKLHFDLKVQTNIYAILQRPRAIDKFALIALISLIVSIIDGPLIQKASESNPKAFNVDAAPVNALVSNATLPDDFSGYGVSPDLMTPIFSQVSRAFSNRESIALPIEGCPAGSTCIFNLPAPGFDVSCTDSTVAYNFSKISAGTENNNLTTFEVTLDFGGTVQDLDKYSTINVTALYKPDSACSGNLIKRSCVLRLATVQYETTTLNGTATITNWREGQNDTIEITKFPRLENSPGYGNVFTGSLISGGFQSMLGGIYLVANTVYKSSVLLRIATTTATPYILYGSGQAASSYLTSDISTYANCSMSWDDPTSDIINTIRELMFRSAIAQSVANASSVVPQQLISHQTRQANAYESHYDYLGITIAVMVVQALAIFLLLFGWHRLGRDVSLDHFEVARALGAPLFQQGSSNSAIDENLKHVKHVRLKYGEAPLESGAPCEYRSLSHGQEQSYGESGTEKTISPVTEPMLETPTSPQHGENDRYVSRRLALHEEGRVREIKPGILY